MCNSLLTTPGKHNASGRFEIVTQLSSMNKNTAFNMLLDYALRFSSFDLGAVNIMNC